MEWLIRNVALIVLSLYSDLAGTCARVLWRHQWVATVLPTQPFLGGIVGRRPSSSAIGCIGRHIIASRLRSGRVTVRPNQSFKPTPLRGAA